MKHKQPIDKQRVKKAQAAIAKANREGNHEKQSDRQMSLIRSWNTCAHAVELVRNNQGGKTAGVDGEVWDTDLAKAEGVKQVWKITNNSRSYKAKGLKEVKIPKPGTTEMRTLRIPTRRDRAVQMVYLRATDPIVENTSDQLSFGFRKGRSANDAVLSLREIYNGYNAPEWGFETDIEKCFDKIQHSAIIERAPNKPGRPLLKQFLSPGQVMTAQNTVNEWGTPQGGIVSPMLANIVLNGMQKAVLDRCGPGTRLFRYADDIWVVRNSKEAGDLAKRAIEDFLGPLGLRIKDSKTRLFNISEGADFRGWNLRKFQRDPRYDNMAGKIKTVVKLQPSHANR
jgi:RNA-directed DNA polymerase